MPKRIRRNREPDINQLVHRSIQKMADAAETPRPTLVPPGMEDSQPIFFPPTQADVSRFMAEMGRRGGKIGGSRRAAHMSKEERSASASKAARARWGKI